MKANLTGVVGTVTGVIALIISVGSFYVNNVRQIDDLRVVIGPPPSPDLKTNGDLLILGSVALTLINSGTRSVAITGIMAVVSRIEKTEAAPKKCPDTGYPLPLKSGSFVIKAGEIVVKTMDIDDDIFTIKDKPLFGETARIIPKGMVEVKTGDRFLACLAMRFVTPDNYAALKVEPVFVYEIGKEMSYEPQFEEGKPIVFYQSTTRIFSR
jgi:hypothetical protein